MLTKKYSKAETKCKVTFTLPTEAIVGAKQVNLIGDFNEWNPALAIPMKKQKDQYKITLELPTGRDYQFRYIGDNGKWANDWAADNYIPSPMDNVDNSVLSLEEVVLASTKRKSDPEAIFLEAKSKSIGSEKKGKSNKEANSISDTKSKSSGTAKKRGSTANKNTKDDLKKIEGIGPKIAEILNAAGITTFESLAAAEVTELKAILEKAGNRYKMHNPSSWGMQAEMAAKGDWEQLAKLQDELDGGKLK